MTDALREGRDTYGLLVRVQRRREFPTRMTQAAQANAHKVFAQVFRNPGPLRAPWQLKVAISIPGITHAIGRAVGVGVRPEHIDGTKRSAAYRNGRLAKIALAFGVAAGVVVVGRKLVRRT